ncbi:MAG: hypothetical protein KJO07_02775 [Deltaproteobacteria bacterium]|jgi:hypothetical protein|nr:hypothetical protein [Deltaproteobacteria bacterium]
MVREGLSDGEIVKRLQARRPDFDISSAPGGSWDWLLGVLAGGLVTVVLVVASRKLIRKGPKSGDETGDESPSGELDEDYEDRLDDELREID